MTSPRKCIEEVNGKNSKHLTETSCKDVAIMSQQAKKDRKIEGQVVDSVDGEINAVGTSDIDEAAKGVAEATSDIVEAINDVDNHDTHSTGKHLKTNIASSSNNTNNHSNAEHTTSNTFSKDQPPVLKHQHSPKAPRDNVLHTLSKSSKGSVPIRKSFSKHLKKPRKVAFKHVEIREMKVDIAGSSVPTDDGPPIGISGKQQRVQLRRLDSYERDRTTGLGASGSPKPLRIEKDSYRTLGHLSAPMRKQMLVENFKEQGNGVNKSTEDAIEECMRDIRSVKRDRYESNLEIVREMYEQNSKRKRSYHKQHKNGIPLYRGNNEIGSVNKNGSSVPSYGVADFF